MEDTFDNIIDIENSQYPHQPLSSEQFKVIASIISENIDYIMSNDVLHQILKLMPVMLLRTKTSSIILNLHEFVYTPRVIEALLLCADKCKTKDNIHYPELLDDDELNEKSLVTPNHENSKTTCGQPSTAK